MILDDFAQHIESFASAHSVSVSYPGVPFTPPDDDRWLELQWVQNGSQEVLIGDEDSSVQIGLFRVLVCDRPGSGVVDQSFIAVELAHQISKGTLVGDQFTGAHITRQPEITGPVTDERNQVIITTVTWRYQSLFGPLMWIHVEDEQFATGDGSANTFSLL